LTGEKTNNDRTLLEHGAVIPPQAIDFMMIASAAAEADIIYVAGRIEAIAIIM
jgi:hypothetical protein